MRLMNKIILTMVLALVVNSQLPLIQERLGGYGELSIKIVDARIDGNVLNADVEISLTNTKDFDYNVEDCVVRIYWDKEKTDLADRVNIGSIYIGAGDTWTDVISISLEGYDGQDFVYLTADATINTYPYHAEQKVRIGI